MPGATSSIPVENLDVLSRYGAESDGVALDKLGGEGWQRRKARMRERILEMAGQLMNAAHRALRQADVLPVDPASYGPFVDRFPWDETEDQDRAIDDVLTDMAGAADGPSGLRRCRLRQDRSGLARGLRGGHGRASGGGDRPTTLLARQHYSNFVERFPASPSRSAACRASSRPGSHRDARALAAGTLDIVVGTHALLSKSVEFKRLGLVIVDEEQRFGVTHKEKLKELKADVHVLTLTATPIPRTLQMAMSGLRELSTIQTPPVDRRRADLCDALGRRDHARGADARTPSRRAELHRRARISDMAEVEEWLRLNVPKSAS
jgi:transcription-repair coupling factor (superfamily II helicase)